LFFGGFSQIPPEMALVSCTSPEEVLNCAVEFFYLNACWVVNLIGIVKGPGRYQFFPDFPGILVDGRRLEHGKFQGVGFPEEVKNLDQELKALFGCHFVEQHAALPKGVIPDGLVQKFIPDGQECALFQVWQHHAPAFTQVMEQAVHDEILEGVLVLLPGAGKRGRIAGILFLGDIQTFKNPVGNRGIVKLAMFFEGIPDGCP